MPSEPFEAERDTEAEIQRSLLERLSAGDESAAPELGARLHEELHRVARRLMAEERPSHTLQTTALVNEAWLRLGASIDAGFEDRRHFLRVAARAMRQVLVDHARARHALKRGAGAERITWDAAEPALGLESQDPNEILALEEALARLEAKDPELLRLVELRFFAGLTLEETAEVLEKSVRQVHWSWTFARGWLRRELERGAPDQES